MQKDIFHNNKSVNKNLVIKKLYKTSFVGEKRNVDINKLLNRVKLNCKSEKKKQVIFFTGALLLISFTGIFISIVR